MVVVNYRVFVCRNRCVCTTIALNVGRSESWTYGLYPLHDICIGNLTVSVGGVEIGTIKLTTSATSYTFVCDEAISGPIELSYTQSSSKAIYIKSIEVTYS